jgi:nicotinamide riboside kinase
MHVPTLRLAVSGTYSSGKTTTTEVLSAVTGIPRTDALTAREILVDLLPGKQFQQLSGVELLTLGLRRLEERIHTEAVAASTGSFVSDGSVLHEWVYGQARMKLGINPGAPLLDRLVKRVIGIPVKPFYQQYMNAYGTVTKARAKRLYDVFVHLPVEFEMNTDGHRPVSEEYRRVCDRLLLETLDELEIPYRVVAGTVTERVEKIIDLFGLPTVMSVPEAGELAAERIRRSKEMVAERQIVNQAPTSTLRRLSYAVRY